MDINNELYNNSIRYIAEKGVCTTGILQRKFNIGYKEAAEIMGKLENAGIITMNVGEIREVLIAPDEVDQYIKA